MTEASSADRGVLIARFTPWSVGLNVGLGPVSATWPGRRVLEVYEHGVFVAALTQSAWIETGEVLLATRVLGGVRLHFAIGADDGVAFVSSARRARIVAALTAAGVDVR